MWDVENRYWSEGVGRGGEKQGDKEAMRQGLDCAFASGISSDKKPDESASEL